MPIVNYPFRTHSAFSTPKPFLPIVITNPDNGFTFLTWAVIDTGADTSAIPEFIGKKLGHSITAVKAETHSGIGGDAKAYYHRAQIEVLAIDSQGNVIDDNVLITVKRKIAIIPELRVTILGENDFLKHYLLTVDYPKQIFSLNKPTS